MSLLSVAGGMFRLGHVGGLEAMTRNARFFTAPWPVALHTVCAAVYCGLGAFPFCASLRHRDPHWHRAAARLLLPASLVAAPAGPGGA